MLALLLATTVATAGEPSGRWVLAEPVDSVQQRIDEVVDAAAAQFGIFRGFARSRLAKGTNWCRAYTFVSDASKVGWACDDRPPFQVERSDLGSTTPRDFGDGEIKVTVRWSEQQVFAGFEGRDGGRSQVFAFDGDGGMRCDVSLHSDRLNAPLSWTLRYRLEK